MPYFRRRRIYRRRLGKRRHHIHRFKYAPVATYTHRYRNAFGLCATPGFIDALESVKKDSSGKVIKRLKTYNNITTEFQSILADYGAPIDKASAGHPYFNNSEELVAMLERYSKYKLTAVKQYAKNFKFLEITVRVKNKDVTDDDRLNVQKYLIQKYSADETSLDFAKDYEVDFNKFEITYQYVNTCRLDYVYRNHTVFSDPAIVDKAVSYGAGDVPVKQKLLHNKSILKQLYYPKSHCYLDSNHFFANKYSNGSFKSWLNALGVFNYPNILFGRPSLGPEQYISTDINTCHFTVVMYDVCVYYKFKFAGMNNLDVQ